MKKREWKETGLKICQNVIKTGRKGKVRKKEKTDRNNER